MKEYLSYASDSSSTHTAPISDSDEESNTDLSKWFIFGPNEDGDRNEEPGANEYAVPDSDYLILDFLHWEVGAELPHPPAEKPESRPITLKEGY